MEQLSLSHLILILILLTLISQSDLYTTLTVLQYSEFDYTLIITSDFCTFIYFHVTKKHPFIFVSRTPFSTSCKARLMVMNSFSLFVRESLQKENFVR